MRSPGEPHTWPESEQEMKRELDAAGIAQDTIWELVNSSDDYPQAVPIVVDWLQHLDERIPPDEDRKAWRLGLLRNLITKNAKGNQAAVDIVFHQFAIEPPLSRLELEVAGFALAKICEPSDFPRVAALIRSDKEFPTKSELVRWIGRIKSDDAKELAVSALSAPATRVAAMRALVQQRATGVRDAVAEYLDDEHAVYRKEAQKTLDKLPQD